MTSIFRIQKLDQVTARRMLDIQEKAKGTVSTEGIDMPNAYAFDADQLSREIFQGKGASHIVLLLNGAGITARHIDRRGMQMDKKYAFSNLLVVDFDQLHRYATTGSVVRPVPQYSGQTRT